MRLGSGLSKLFAMIGAFFSFGKRGKVESSALTTGKQHATLTSSQASRMAAKGTSETKARTRYKTDGPSWLKIALNSRR